MIQVLDWGDNIQIDLEEKDSKCLIGFIGSEEWRGMGMCE
jgi:hypothetical protein